MVGLTLVAVLLAVIGFSNGISIGRFENLTSGIYDAWRGVNPENVHGDNFGLVSVKDNLYLITRCLFRKNFEDPWDPSSRGGMVSTFRVSNDSWIHKSYNRLDDDQFGDKLFSLNGRLFMLTYSTNMKKIGYHKLFFWDDLVGEWLETPFEIDPTASTISTNSIQSLSLNVPDQNGSLAYLVASAHANAQSGSELAFSRLDIQFRGSVPIKATLKSIARAQIDNPSAVVFTAIKGDHLIALVSNFFSEGYVPQFELAYTVDLKTNQVGNVSLQGAMPTMDFDGDRMFQINNQVLVVGGRRMVGLGKMEDVKDIWSLNLDTLQWTGTNSLIPDHTGSTFAVDQTNGILYAADLKDGVSVAQVIE